MDPRASLIGLAAMLILTPSAALPENATHLAHSPAGGAVRQDPGYAAQTSAGAVTPT